MIERFRAYARHPITLTMVTNFLTVGATGVVGILLARLLGEAGRGHYAAIAAWYGVGLTLGELGQGAAVVYFTSRRPDKVRENTRLARRIMLAASALVCLLAFVAAPVLSSRDSTAQPAYYLAAVGVLLNGLMAANLFSFQATNLALWNLLRSVQPVANLLTVLGLVIAGRASLMAAVMCLVGSTFVQLVVASIAFRRAHSPRTGLACEPDNLLSFGIKQAGSAVPNILTTNLDRLYLSQAASAAQLGQYAVAQSVLSVAGPVGSAIASVAFPKFAARREATGRLRAELRVLGLTLASVAPMVLLLVLIGPCLIPLFFGAEFEPAVSLLIWIAPAVVAQNVLVVLGALLRGRGKPGMASIANTVALVAATGAMQITVPRFGVGGAALGAAIGNTFGVVIMAVVLVEGRRGPGRT